MVLRAFRAAALAAALMPIVASGQRPAALPLKLEPRPTVGAITREDLMTRLYQIADDSMGGRPTGSEGHVKVTAYIAAEAKRLGLLPGGDDGSYFQSLPVVSRGFVAGGSIRVAGKRFALGSDFGGLVLPGRTPAASAGGSIVVGGVMGDTTTWISAEEAAGKIVLLKASPRVVTMYPRGFYPPVSSRFAGAAAVLMGGWDAMPSTLQAATMRRAISRVDDQPTRAMPLALIISDAMAKTLMAAEGQHIAMDVAYEQAAAPARNVVAILPGSDPRLRGQYVALGAHSDHDPLTAWPVDHDSLRAANAKRSGTSPTLLPRGTYPARQDSIKNGADDDGTGTVALLEIAEAMATAPVKPRRSTLFVWHVAEELGLWGAEHFTSHPTVPLDSVVAQLNMDMIGRGGVGDIENGGPQFLLLVGSRRLSKELGDVLESVNAARDFSFKFDYSWDADGHPQRIYCRSDHALYARQGIPVTFFFTGLHLDYHQVTDEPQYIDYDKLYHVAGLVLDAARELGNRDQRPRLDGPKPSPNAACRQ
ncbi:MAG: M28 family peptidase [Gemmatimonadaceae bacterium]|nr:M28 family peptidase [Gemmatimonadaceae bacterium]